MLKNKTIVRVVIPLLILLVIGGIWTLKNRGQVKEQTQAQEQSQEQDDVQQEEVMDDVVKRLEATVMDLEELKSYGLPIMIDFGADSCIPCKEMAPILKEINEQYQGKVIVKFVDVWKHPELSEDFPVQVIPTQFFFDANGDPFVPENPEAMGMQMYAMKDNSQHIYTAHQGGMSKEQILAVFSELGVEN